MVITTEGAPGAARRTPIALLESISRESRATYIALALICALGLGGCATVLEGHPTPVTNPKEDLSKLSNAIGSDALLTCLEIPSEACRNKFVGARMYASDLRFTEFEQKLFRDGRITGFGGSVAATGISAAAAVASAGAANALSALNTLLLGSRTAYQKELLGDHAALTLHTTMRTRRTQVGLRLRAGLGKTINEYPFGLALADLNDYIQAGTILGALIGVTETVGAESQQAQTDLRDLTVDYSQRGLTARQIRTNLCNGVPNCMSLDENRVKAARGCFVQAKLPSDTLILDITSGSLAVSQTQREALLHCLKKN